MSVWGWEELGLGCARGYETRGCVLHRGRVCRKVGQMGESYIPGHLPWGFLHTMEHPGLEDLPTQEPVMGRGLSKAVGVGGVSGFRSELDTHVQCYRGTKKMRMEHGPLGGLWRPLRVV